MLTIKFKAIIHNVGEVKTSKKNNQYARLVVTRPNVDAFGEPTGEDDIFAIHIGAKKLDEIKGLQKGDKVEINAWLGGKYKDTPQGGFFEMNLSLQKVVKL